MLSLFSFAGIIFIIKPLNCRLLLDTHYLRLEIVEMVPKVRLRFVFSSCIFGT